MITGIRPAPYFTAGLTQPIDLGNSTYLLGILYGTVSGSGVAPTAVVGILEGENFTEIGQSDPTRKAAALTVWREGRDAFMIASQEAQPKSGGNTSVPVPYTFPDVLPAPPPIIDETARNWAGAALRWVRGVRGLPAV